MTPNSSLTSYCSPASFLLRYDNNLVGQLVSDNSSQIQPSDLPNNAILNQLLKDASGQVEAAALIGGRYSVSDLQSLTGVSQAFLQHIVSAITMGLLRQRRGMIEEGTGGFYQQALDALKALSNGTAIFSFAETEAAGSVLNYFFENQDFYRQRLLSNNIRAFGVLVDRRTWFV